MANVIKLRKGLDISIEGKAREELISVDKPKLYSLIPDDYIGIFPKVAVKEQEVVKAGTPLLFDRNNPEIKFVSPVSGVVKQVQRGARRKILNIIVEADKEQQYVDFGVKKLSDLSREDVIQTMLASGLFAFLKERPYDVVANPKAKPKAIFISAFDSNPLARSFEYALLGQEENFQYGLDVLAKITKVHLGISVKSKSKALIEAKNVTVTAFDGPHPAGNVGVHIHHVSPINAGEVVWTIDPEAVLFIARLFKTGKVDFTRTIAITGSEVKSPSYAKVIVGSQLTDLFETNVKDTTKSLRYISGNVLTGRKIEKDSFLGAMHTQVTVIPEGDDVNELFGWAMPRLKQFSVNRSYLTWLLPKKKYTFDARVKGGHRNMIMSNEYDKVFPMDILPEFLIKSIIANDIDRMEQLGIYEVAPEDFSLCEFVCSSKMELQKIVREGLDRLRKEMC
ncbi:MAG: Na(+)-translocating NADH-quinone reductase subunit A [Bacteroides sp.]|nr:Na(+)-translocating NADH-quinone reductase subunit A [Bacteroides sp.]MDD2645228.1 Na(+)-translocating NADH-quinone reductase subunit A [Bacteroides sp.]MDD4720480.1 Na(+)-translocating NADH-quinone reductase subunit A [Bacteroides sp.]NLI63546.1 Na(+)-translocating NADH-quinone reductase subunit A [Bacteroidales bacterium]